MVDFQWKKVTKQSKLCATWKSSILLRPPFLSQRCATSDEIQAFTKCVEKSNFWKSLNIVLEKIISMGANFDQMIEPNIQQRTGKVSLVDDCQTSVTETPWLLCFGIGSSEIGDRANFMAQLCILILIKQKYNIPFNRTWISDPVCSKNDHALFKFFDFSSDLPTQSKTEWCIESAAVVALGQAHETMGNEGLSHQKKMHMEKNSSEVFDKRSDQTDDNTTQLVSFINFGPIFINCAVHGQKEQVCQVQQKCTTTLQQRARIDQTASIPERLGVVSSPVVIIFMPHCDKSLYGEVLRTLKIKNILSRCILIGNRLDQYDRSQANNFHNNDCCSVESVDDRRKLNFIQRALKVLDESQHQITSIHLQTDCSAAPRAFNDLCVSLIGNR